MEELLEMLGFKHIAKKESADEIAERAANAIFERHKGVNFDKISKNTKTLWNRLSSKDKVVMNAIIMAFGEDFSKTITDVELILETDPKFKTALNATFESLSVGLGLDYMLQVINR